MGKLSLGIYACDYMKNNFEKQPILQENAIISNRNTLYQHHLRRINLLLNIKRTCGTIIYGNSQP
jgi:hypothetical protein